MKRFFLFFICIAIQSSFAQQKWAEIHINITGDIVPDFKQVNLINKTSEETGKVIGENLFGINIMPNDTLIIVGDVITKSEFKVSQAIYNNGYASFSVFTTGYLLGTAELNLGLTGDIEKDLSKFPVKKYLVEISEEDLKVKLDDYAISHTDLARQETNRNMPWVPMGAGIGFGFGPGPTEATMFYNKMNKQRLMQSRIIGYFGYDMFIKDLELPKEKVYDFVDYCITRYDIDSLFRQRQYYYITKILQGAAKVYKY